MVDGGDGWVVVFFLVVVFLVVEMLKQIYIIGKLVLKESVIFFLDSGPL